MDCRREDLEDLLTDPLYFQAVFHSTARAKALLQAQAELGLANESIAKRNLALQNDLYKLRSETQAAFDEAKFFQDRWKEVEKQQKELYSRLSPSFLLMRLKHSATAQDDLSESLASSFIHPPPPVVEEGSTLTDADIDRFVKEFKETRKTFHKRVIWADRWSNGRVSWRED
ncbi:hypothetical protein FRC02_005159 [Tulasnella sp. 418]|nr:hypothetical protein FRC02_005159 [Tulasnella sp. 418]